MSTVIKKIKIQKWLKSTDFKKHSKKHKPYKMYIPFLFKTLQSFLVVTDGSRPRGILSPHPSPCWAPSHILCWCLCPLPGMPILQSCTTQSQGLSSQSPPPGDLPSLTLFIHSEERLNAYPQFTACFPVCYLPPHLEDKHRDDRDVSCLIHRSTGQALTTCFL